MPPGVDFDPVVLEELNSARDRRLSVYTTASGRSGHRDPHDESVDDSAENETVSLFKERWESVDNFIADMSIFRKREPRMRVSDASSSNTQRSSTASSLLAASFDVISPVSTPNTSTRSSGNHDAVKVVLPSVEATPPPKGRDRSNTATSQATSTAPSTTPSTAPSTKTSKTNGSPSFPPSSRTYSDAGAYKVYSGIPLSPKEQARKEQKKREKEEKAAAIKLVKDRAKESAKANRLTDTTSHAFFPGLIGGGFLGGGGMFSASFAPTRASASSPPTAEKEFKVESRPLSSSKTKRSSSSGVKESGTAWDIHERERDRDREAETAARQARKKADREAERRRSKESEENVALRTKEVLFGLLPALVIDDANTSRTLPTLHQMSPTLQLPPGAYPMDASISTPPLAPSSPSRHPYAYDGGDDESDGSYLTPLDEAGMWESMFDPVQQSYVFQPQPSSPPPPSKEAMAKRQNTAPIPPSVYPLVASSPSNPRHGPSDHRRAATSPPAVHFARSRSPSPPVQIVESPGEDEHETLYIVHCVHPFRVPPGTVHLDLPFLNLEVGDVVDILLEDGHPNTHEGLPIYIDEGDDCMLVGRDERGDIGWCLASFVMPLM